MPIYLRPKRNTFSESTKYSSYRVACFCDLMLKESLEEPHIWMLYIYEVNLHLLEVLGIGILSFVNWPGKSLSHK